MNKWKNRMDTTLFLVIILVACPQIIFWKPTVGVSNGRKAGFASLCGWSPLIDKVQLEAFPGKKPLSYLNNILIRSLVTPVSHIVTLIQFSFVRTLKFNKCGTLLNYSRSHGLAAASGWFIFGTLLIHSSCHILSSSSCGLLDRLAARSKLGFLWE